MGLTVTRRNKSKTKRACAKKVHSVDDVTFLSSMISFIVQSDSSNNPAKGLVG